MECCICPEPAVDPIGLEYCAKHLKEYRARNVAIRKHTERLDAKYSKIRGTLETKPLELPWVAEDRPDEDDSRDLTKELAVYLADLKAQTAKVQKLMAVLAEAEIPYDGPAFT